jgi:4-diphosphocytidyl-2-C-methyl-D-erythritol kinase
MPETLAPLTRQAHAKINLTLDVLGKRPDGYHALASVMTTISLADAITLHPAEDGVVSLECNVPELCGDDNLVVRAARLVQRATGCDRGVHIALHKQVPAQGGLGGGSSDAAAVLLGLNQWWNLALAQDQLIDLAAELGSDVPFFIIGGTALIEGRGEFVTPLPPIAPLWLVIVKPPVSIATAAVFRALTPAEWSDGAATRDLVSTIRAGQMPALTDATLFNALEAGVLRAYPAVAEMRRALLDLGAPCVRMSGSGPTLFIPCATQGAAEQIWRAGERQGAWGMPGAKAFLTQTVIARPREDPATA